MSKLNIMTLKLVKGLCFLDESLKFKPIKNTIKRSKPINSRKDSDLSP